MALFMHAKVFRHIAAHRLEAELQRWLTDHAEVEVRFVSQSEHVEGNMLYVTVSLLYTEPSDRDRAMQARMQGGHA